MSGHHLDTQKLPHQSRNIFVRNLRIEYPFQTNNEINSSQAISISNDTAEEYYGLLLVRKYDVCGTQFLIRNPGWDTDLKNIRIWLR